MTGKRGPNASSVRTRAAILDAVLRTLRDEGIADTSARAIARAGDFNQALIFYHFGSVDDALVAAFEGLVHRQSERYDEALTEATSFDQICKQLTALFQEDSSGGVATTIAQACAGAAHRGHMGGRMRAVTRTWLDVVAAHGERVGLSRDAARYGADRFLALYLGFELMRGLKGQGDDRLVDLTDVEFVPDERDVITSIG